MPTVLSRVLRWLVVVAILAALLFGVSGRWDLPMLWGYFAVVSGVALVAVFKVDPELAQERLRPGPGGVDRVTRPLVGTMAITHLVLASLDLGRFHWSDTIPQSFRLGALPVFTASMALILWAQIVNRFFSPIVRIQSERGHHLVTAGPYRFVRHPGYLGMVIGLPASALALGSWCSLAPAAAFSLIILRRTVIEDGFVMQNLEGYTGYARQVRYRLVPGLW